MGITVVTAHTADVTPDMLRAARALLFEVFDDMTEHDWEHCLGGMHAIASVDGKLVGHAALVQRRLLHEGRPLRTGYVEGVAVRASQRRTGVGAALMTRLEQIILCSYDLGALGATDEAATFYAKRNWRLWQGPLFALTPQGIIPTPDEEDCIFVFAKEGAPLSWDRPLTCDFREGDVW